MPRQAEKVPRPQPDVFLRALRELAPGADVPVEGREAIRQWFWRYGFRGRDGQLPSWRTLMDWRVRAGEPFAWYGPAIGRHAGRVISSHLILLRWAMCQAQALGPPTTTGWRPGPRALRKRRAAGRAL